MNDYRHPQVVNADEVPSTELSYGNRFQLTRRQLGMAAGARKLGCTLVELPPGKRSWPLHYHAANEEAIYILEGQGRVRIGDRDVPIRAGDYVALLSGPDGAHQTFNDSTAVLRYLCISTMIDPEVNFYPESNRVGFFAGSAPGGDREQRFLEGFVSLDARQDYWAGEKVDDDSACSVPLRLRDCCLLASSQPTKKSTFHKTLVNSHYSPFDAV